jgi:hypothetical protein
MSAYKRERERERERETAARRAGRTFEMLCLRNWPISGSTGLPLRSNCPVGCSKWPPAPSATTTTALPCADVSGAMTQGGVMAGSRQREREADREGITQRRGSRT